MIITIYLPHVSNKLILVHITRGSRFLHLTMVELIFLSRFRAAWRILSWGSWCVRNLVFRFLRIIKLLYNLVVLITIVTRPFLPSFLIECEWLETLFLRFLHFIYHNRISRHFCILALQVMILRVFLSCISVYVNQWRFFFLIFFRKQLFSCFSFCKIFRYTN